MFIHNLAENHVTGALTSKQICDSDVCTSALIGRPGFVCVAEPYGNNTQRCAIMYYCDHQRIDCGKHGHCYVETEIQSERVSYSSKCRCCSINLTSVKKNGFFFCYQVDKNHLLPPSVYLLCLFGQFCDKTRTTHKTYSF